MSLRALPPEEARTTVTEFFTGAVDNSEMEALAAKVAETTSDGLWDMTEFELLTAENSFQYDGRPIVQPPKYERWMDSVQFLDVAKRLRPETSDKIITALFMVLAQGNAGYIQKFKVDEYLSSWRGGNSGFNSGAFQATAFGAKLNMGFAYWFLNIFAPFCTYFFFLRAPGIQFLGIDLLPGTPKFWEKGV